MLEIPTEALSALNHHFCMFRYLIKMFKKYVPRYYARALRNCSLGTKTSEKRILGAYLFT